MKYFVTAIGTDSGKTLVSAILCEALRADYWKPVQAGLPRDADQVAKMVTEKITVLPERWVLKTPASPHAAARIDGVEISLDDFVLPESQKLVVEGAGGALVPLNDKDFVIDIATRLRLPAILVSNLYLGSINHTLLTAEALKRREVNVAGIIFNGPANAESERIILHHTGFKLLLNIQQEATVNKEIVRTYAERLRKSIGQ